MERFVSSQVHEIDYKQSVFHVHIAQSVVTKCGRVLMIHTMCGNVGRIHRFITLPKTPNNKEFSRSVYITESITVNLYHSRG